ncbi:hypothetical protein V5O48_008098 [Marasmius crinis-equi]|uniref:Uncharacterized protein n=1 Tax=Marasmius crinis-equi TaxID=585013 RepID=A0ABR3FEU6_9AGAR
MGCVVSRLANFADDDGITSQLYSIQLWEDAQKTTISSLLLHGSMDKLDIGTDEENLDARATDRKTLFAELDELDLNTITETYVDVLALPENPAVENNEVESVVLINTMSMGLSFSPGIWGGHQMPQGLIPTARPGVSYTLPMAWRSQPSKEMGLERMKVMKRKWDAQAADAVEF